MAGGSTSIYLFAALIHFLLTSPRTFSFYHYDVLSSTQSILLCFVNQTPRTQAELMVSYILLIEPHHCYVVIVSSERYLSVQYNNYCPLSFVVGKRST